MPTVTIGGKSINYVQQGAGRTVVLIHGFPLDSRMWTAQAADLSASARVIALDLAGFGQSPSSEAFTIASQAKLIHSMLQQLNALPSIITGLSMGGYIALSYVRQFANDVSGLILVDTKAEADTPEGRAGRNKMIELVKASGSKAVADQMMPRMLSADTVQRRPHVVRELRSIMESVSARTIENALVAMREREDQTPLLPTIKIPTLILVGKDDAITPPTVAQTMHKAIANSKLEEIADAGHMTPMEQPDHVSRAIRSFLSGLN
jgi:pimeloyl-ACP methyl ester carboxylesterase